MSELHESLRSQPFAGAGSVRPDELAIALSARSVTKRFGGLKAVDEVTLSIPEGSVFGFLGPNGAGKTTMLRMLAGLSVPDSGSITFFGEDSERARMRGEIAYLPDVPGFYPWMTAPEVMQLAASLTKVDSGEAPARIDSLLKMVGLEGVSTAVGGFSRGMKQRLGMAQALVGAPRLLMLDEPTSALDPIGRRELLDLVASLRGRTTIVFSTHILADVERVCDHLAIIDKGRLVKQGTIDEFRTLIPTRTLELTVTSDAAALGERVAARRWSESVSLKGKGRLRVVVNDLSSARYELPGMIAELGMGIVQFEGGDVDLEDVFVKLVGGDAR